MIWTSFFFAQISMQGNDFVNDPLLTDAIYVYVFGMHGGGFFVCVKIYMEMLRDRVLQVQIFSRNS